MNGHSAATVRRLKMYNTRPKRDRKGKVLKNDLQSNELPDTRIQPDRRWFDDFEEKYAENVTVEGSEEDGFRDLVRHTMFEKGQSKRIWGELYKVIDSSDVVVQVLDARDPQGTSYLLGSEFFDNFFMAG
ncbi:nuclear/nucleolar GTPase 2-like [Cucumis melo var. makuwa]|uniref:Nuclear/nucleolar GTPase 2-like n=1 Tax=Cucumis melo var. makuwa TaxID=1194695 RepID=A0A5D3B975_CUCMM|nr:nuclear/nucleolar GTPase 2-like [Cucumis melo var. makuwa]TYJ95677.1 nuclear/nucleolar GTPase 2-like [Cucumis melo var. makuwa]